MLALIKNNNIIVPLNYSQSTSNLLKKEIAEVNVDIKIDENDNVTFENLNKETNHPLLKELIFHNVPGLVLFTSGTSGQPKAAVNDLTKLLEKFRTKRKALRTINFLLFDHWGGLNTMFHSLSNRGVVLALRDRNPESVCEFIQNYKIELLPASPTFLNLLLISEAYKKYDLSSIELITYGHRTNASINIRKIK